MIVLVRHLLDRQVGKDLGKPRACSGLVAQAAGLVLTPQQIHLVTPEEEGHVLLVIEIESG